VAASSAQETSSTTGTIRIGRRTTVCFLIASYGLRVGVQNWIRICSVESVS
jgi:hypothetical protein